MNRFFDELADSEMLMNSATILYLHLIDGI